MRPWVSGDHRRMMKKEEKAKVVAAVLGGAEWINFFAALAILHLNDLKKGMKSSYYSDRSGAIHSILHIVLVQFILFLKSSMVQSS